MDPNYLHSAFVIDTVPNLSDVRAWLQRSNRWLRGGTNPVKTWDEEEEEEDKKESNHTYGIWSFKLSPSEW